MSRRNNVPSVRLQLTVDENTYRVLEEMAELGIHGANRAEAASWIIRNWIWTNQSQLRDNGIVLRVDERHGTS